MSRELPWGLICLLPLLWQTPLVARDPLFRVECKSLPGDGDPVCGEAPVPAPDLDQGPRDNKPPINRGCDNIAGTPIHHNVRWAQVWQALNDRGGCTTSCHLGTAPAADLDFSSRELAIYYLVSQQSTQGSVFRVVAGSARDSLFYQKISCATPAVGVPMPPPAGHLPTDVQALVYDWIEQGAYGESNEDPIPRLFMFKDSLETMR